jgi:hypothetical protein
MQDLDVLNDDLYMLSKGHDMATAMLVEWVNKLEDSNRHLWDENESQCTTLKKPQGAIHRLEIISALPLLHHQSCMAPCTVHAHHL